FCREHHTVLRQVGTRGYARGSTENLDNRTHLRKLTVLRNSAGQATTLAVATGVRSPFIVRISLLLKESVSCTVTELVAVIWNPPLMTGTFKLPLGTVYITLGLPEKLTVTTVTLNRIMSYLPAGSGTLPSTCERLSTLIMSIVCDEILIVCQALESPWPAT